MNDPDPNTSPKPKVLGDYRLIEQLEDGTQTRVWLAEQVSVGRTVVVEDFHDPSPEAREAFVADVRAKASVDHPLIGSVYEAVTTDGHCYVARERLTGPSFGERLAASATLKPATFAPALRKLAEAELYLEGKQLAATPLALHDIHLDERGVLRINNPVVAGERKPDSSAIDIDHFGRQLRPLIADAHPGSTRTITLLSWMAGENSEVPRLDWRKVHGYATQIDQQLTEPPQPPPPQTAPARLASHGKNRATFWLGIAAAALVIVCLAWIFTRPQPIPPRGLPAAVQIPANKYRTPDGEVLPLREFWLAGHEVTIGQYARFLESLGNLAPDQHGIYNAEGQPAEKTSHQPDDWAALLQAASAGGTWNDLPLSMDCPVVGVDWWDAAAYCEWKRGRLPTQEEWFAGASGGGKNPANLESAPWGPVASLPADQTLTGIYDLAGSVAEWTRRPAANPSLPLAGKKNIIIGGSYLIPDSGIRTRQWIDDRSTRRPDLGFRIAFDYQPSE